MLKVGHVTSDLLCFLGSHTLLLMQDPNPDQCPSGVPRCTQEVSHEARKQVRSAAAGFRSALLPLGQLCMSTSAGHGHGHRALCLLPTSTTFRHKAAQSPSMNTCPSTEASVMPQNFRGAKAWQSVARLEGIALLCASRSSPACSCCLKEQSGVGLFHFFLRVLSPWGIGTV